MDFRIRVVLRMSEEQSGKNRECVGKIATLLGLSQEHLLRLFKREVGRTFQEHLLEVRMRSAADLLSIHSRAIKEIALALDYSDVSNFYRDFKRVYGTTPRQWRLTHLRVSASTCQIGTTRRGSMSARPLEIDSVQVIGGRSCPSPLQNPLDLADL